ncbi:MAG: hypothetical protein ACLQAT_12080 [Candidatus Binataceae bacterium]
MAISAWISRWFRGKTPGSVPPAADDSGGMAELARLADQARELIDASGVDQGEKAMWTADVGEAYYSALAASELVTRGSGAAPAESVRAILASAASRAGQVASELRTLGAEGAAVAAAFETLRARLEKTFGDSAPPASSTPPTARVAKISDEEFRLLCSVCGQPAAGFRIGENSLSKAPVLIYAGPAKRALLARSEAEPIFAMLADDAIAAVHQRVQADVMMEEGLDVYCPSCDRIYCRAHYAVTEEWDAGFYDCARGTCPFGHTRIIDD